jgi:hypothetical protein
MSAAWTMPSPADTRLGRDRHPPIAEHVIGDLHSAALVATDGSAAKS